MTKYKVPDALASPTVESIEIITEFRRMEMIAEAHAAANDLFARGGAIRDAEEALKPYRGQLSIVAHVQFGLLTIGAPNVIIAVTGGPSPTPQAVDAKMKGIYVGDSLVGGDFEAIFRADSIGQTTRVVTVTSNGAQLQRVTVDFGALE